MNEDELKKEVLDFVTKNFNISDRTFLENIMPISIPYLQRKYKISYEKAKEIYDFVKNELSEMKPHIPNQETCDALDATDKGEGLIHYDSLEAFFRSMQDD